MNVEVSGYQVTKPRNLKDLEFCKQEGPKSLLRCIQTWDVLPRHSPEKNMYFEDRVASVYWR